MRRDDRIYIGIDIGKKTCVACIKDKDKNVLEQASYRNTLNDATRFARQMKNMYGQCTAACEATGSLWFKTFMAFDQSGITIRLANTYKAQDSLRDISKD